VPDQDFCRPRHSTGQMLRLK